LIRAASPRQVSVEQVRHIAADLPPAVHPVLLYRDAPVDAVCEELRETRLDWVQLHGGESVGYVRELLFHFPRLNLIRAWEVRNVSSATELTDYLADASDEGVRFSVVILDAPKGGEHPGYECLGEVSRRCRGLAGEFWCAGGLTPENVQEAIAAGQYEGVDVARGVEQSPGVKNHDALASFISTARML